MDVEIYEESLRDSQTESDRLIQQQFEFENRVSNYSFKIIGFVVGVTLFGVAIEYIISIQT